MVGAIEGPESLDFGRRGFAMVGLDVSLLRIYGCVLAAVEDMTFSEC